VRNSRPEARDPKFVASIVIPAHNEAAVIGRLLESLFSIGKTGNLQVIVACNGCTDNTADVARRYGATVVEIEASSKIEALNAADDVAVAFPRLYVDADVIVTRNTIDDLIHALSKSDILCVAPPSRMELTGRPWTVRAFFAVWKQVMLAKEGYVGSGVYGISQPGRERFGRFPDVVADDLFVRNTYARSERRIVTTEPTIVEAPRTLRALLRRRVRVSIGNNQLATHPDFQFLPGNRERSISWWRVVLKNPSLIPASFVYLFVSGTAHIVASRKRRNDRVVDWARDDTTRLTP
jgi:glycosyltransferase involved in cell wall biosynthesis